MAGIPEHVRRGFTRLYFVAATAWAVFVLECELILVGN